MEQAQFPIDVKQGATLVLPIYYFDEDDLPIDLTGCTAAMQARVTVNAEDDSDDNPKSPLFSWTTENGNISINGSTGLVLLGVSAAQTALLSQVIDYVYDLFLTFPSGVKVCLLSGPLSVIGRVTK